jgi:glucan 1,3-beta-glucosidase
MPKDPRDAIGVCGNANPWNPPLQAWQTGGTGAGNIPATVSAALVWPPPVISNGGAISILPSYTPTGSLVTLPVPTFTPASTASTTINAGNGWANNGDTAGMMVQVPSCSYLDPWVGPTPPPSPLCAGAPQITPAPTLSA